MRNPWYNIIFLMCLHQPRIKGVTQRPNVYEELKEVFLSTSYGVYGPYKNYVRIIEWGQVFTNQHLGMKADMKIAVLMVPE
jgi:hypothetical protein